jgi:predicted  nucleic acid-binding Zn-ribbon protein
LGVGVQAKAIAGLEGFKRKLESDLEYVEGKLDAIRHVRAELEEHMRRLTEVLQGLNNKTEAERRALDRLTDDFNQLKADREAQMRREEQERDQMNSQVKPRLRVGDRVGGAAAVLCYV